MGTWTSNELTRIAEDEELEIAPRRSDDTLLRPRTIWVVREGDDLYVRSVNGPSSVWYRITRDCREGHIRAGGVDRDVTFVDVGHDLDDRINTAYRTKYRRYADSILDQITSSEAASTTIRIVPRQASP